MAETSHEIRRELEVTRERVGDTIAALERKVNPKHILDEHPLIALGVAFGAGVLLGSTGTGSTAARAVRTQVRTQMRTLKSAVRGNTARMNTSFMQSVGDVAGRVVEGISAAAMTAGATKVSELIEAIAGRYGGIQPGADAAFAPSSPSSRHRHSAPTGGPSGGSVPLSGGRW